MKKLLLILPIVCVLASCKKEGPESEKKYQFSFSSEFKQSEGPLSKAAGEVSQEGDILQDYVESLTLLIYDSRTGARVFQTRQHSRDNLSNFGTIGGSLPSGSYTARLIGHNELQMFDTYNPSLTWLWAGIGDFGNLFMKKIDFTVNASDISQSVRLERINAGVEITVEDPIPDIAAFIRVSIDQDIEGYYFAGNHTFASKIKNYTLTDADKGLRGKQFLFYTLNTFKPFTIKIAALDKNMVPFTEKTISNLTAFPNRKILLRGELFPKHSSSFIVSVNPVWEAPCPPVVFREKQASL